MPVSVRSASRKPRAGCASAGVTHGDHMAIDIDLRLGVQRSPGINGSHSHGDVDTVAA